jgi:non-ribosomal peptide synthetase component F
VSEPNEKNLVASQFEGMGRGGPHGTCLPELLLEQAQEQPDSPAVVYGNDHITYSGLADSSADLAAYLHHLGVTPDDCVGLFVEPSIDLMTGVWGILFAGGAYLPLSPDYPEERLRYMIEDARVRIIFSQEELKERVESLAPADIRVITPADVAEYLRTRGNAERSALDVELRQDNLAYVIYTSGSTGKPKGVMIEHRSIVNQLRWLKAGYGLNRDSTVLQKTPMSFDAAQWEILAVGLGAEVVMGSPGVYRDPDKLIESVNAYQVTVLQCVPTLLQALISTDELHTCRSLERIFCGGEALSTNLALQAVETLPGCDLVNL